MAEPPVDKLHNLKRKRTRERANVTRLVVEINGYSETTPADDYHYSQGRLQETLNKLVVLDDAIHDLLSDSEFQTDVEKCDEYIDSAKRAIHRAAKGLDERLAASTSSLRVSPSAPVVSASSFVRLPTMKLEPFAGNVEAWSRFWEQFQSSVDQNPSVSQTEKHVFLRGYLEGEPKRLVDGIPVTADNYEQTKKILRSKYGDKNRIIQAHLDYLENLSPTLHDDPESLNTTYVECNRRIQALIALGEDVDAYGRVLAPKILRAFPDALCCRWLIHSKRTNTEEGNLSALMTFLNEEVDGALTASKIRGEVPSHSDFTPTAATLHVHSKQKRIERRKKRPAESFCVFCEGRNHWAQDCTTVRDVNSRIQKLKATNRCFLCLNRGHNSRACSKRGRAQCSNCGGGHHRAVCQTNRDPVLPTSQTLETSVIKIDVSSPDFTYLQTARVWITGPTGRSKLTRCVLDGGSQSSFVNKSLIDELLLEVIDNKTLSVSSFETVSPTSSPRRLVQMNIRGIWTNFSIPVLALESDHSFSPHPRVPHDIQTLGNIRKLQLADPKDNCADLPIELLIGGDQYWRIVKNTGPVRLSPSLVLLPSRFGWILSGSRSGITVDFTTVSYINLGQAASPQDDELRRFWDLETIGISLEQPQTISERDSSLLSQFHATHRLQNGRRVVSLPRKEHVSLSSNYHHAKKRFHSLERRLERDETLRKVYHDQMFNYIRQEHVEIAPPTDGTQDTYYLPHHLVKKDKRGHLKWRIVFDGAAHERDAPSLNDALEMGPNLLPELLSLMLRFRQHPLAIIGDIRQAFLQLTLHQKDRNLTRFLWYQCLQHEDGSYTLTDEVVTYRFTRLPFGLTCSPFLLSATLRELAIIHEGEFPQAAALINDHMFMDDFVAAVETDNNVISLYYQLVGLMKKIEMPMARWATNSQQLKDIWTAEGRDIKQQAQVLGIDWNTELDTFNFDHRDVTDKVADGPTTKRHLLRAAATFYDPLGLASPTSVVAKILFQDTWCRGIGWDELLPHDLGVRWRYWISTLTSLSSFNIPRCVRIMHSKGSQVHVFCDASERAYGAALYVRNPMDHDATVQLMCSKNRLAPLKRVTLPRLELLAALLGARLLRYFCQATDYPVTDATLWSDSLVTLGWIRGDPNNWKTFVCNRVTEIQTSTAPSQWRHCPGRTNPADCLSRGLTADKLASFSLWWKGPVWLAQPPDCWPHDTNVLDPTLPEAKKTVNQVLTVSLFEPLLQISRFSSLWKVLHITALVIRFIHILKRNERPPAGLTASEIHKARMYWIRAVQLECFPEEVSHLKRGVLVLRTSKIACFNPYMEDGLIRLGGRLQFSRLTPNEKHPIILDGSHHFTKLLIMQTHVQLHHLGVHIVLTELRQQFWILRARQAIRKVLHDCMPCKIARNRHADALEAPLPADRVQPTKPFSHIGIDFAGPLYIRSGGTAKKAYILLITCSATRALHLELTTDLSTDRFLMALQRFVGRRGLPHTIYSDNGQTFHAANKELKEFGSVLLDPRTHQYLAHHNVTWKFIPPRAAWWGGWWERMVGSVKRCLRKTLGKLQTDEEQTNTLLVSIEAALNSRPLTKADDQNTLTPAHFLTGERLTTIPSGQTAAATSNLSKLYRLRQKIADDFWRRWTKDYLLELRSFHTRRNPRKSAELKIGDVVLLQEDHIRRHMWKLARVEGLRPGRDGVARTVLLRTTHGSQIARPIQLVIPLEIGIDQGGEDVEDTHTPSVMLATLKY